MKKLFTALFAVVMLFALAITPAIATVRSLAIDQKVHPGASIRIPLQLTSDQQIAGINGVFNYDTNIFTNPRIDSGAAATYFITEGYERPDDPGNYRYVVYADPTATMALTQGAVVYFLIDVKMGLADSTVTNISYTTSAASNPLGESLADVSFSDARIEISTGTNDWALYE